MNIELRPMADIKPYDKNPRINDAAVEAVAEYDYRANQGYADIGIRLITLVPKEETRSGT